MSLDVVCVSLAFLRIDNDASIPFDDNKHTEFAKIYKTTSFYTILATEKAKVTGMERRDGGK
jgi:hypothetical protein